MTDSLEQRIKQVLKIDDKRLAGSVGSAYGLSAHAPQMAAIIRELLGVIDSLHGALEGIAKRPDLPNSDRDADWKNCQKWSSHEAKQALTLSAPLAGWKEWGV